MRRRAPDAAPMRSSLRYLALLGLLACKKDDPVIAEHTLTPSTASGATLSAKPSSEPKIPTPDEIGSTLAAAIAKTKPLMIDKFNQDSDGSILFAVWAQKKMSWSDVGIAKNETTVASALKDIDEERGKRICLGGSIVEIAVEKLRDGKIGVGIMITDSVEPIRFFAAKSSGALVKQSPARFCGVVTGKYDYSNSGGGTGHAISMVGMFDLPENKK